MISFSIIIPLMAGFLLYAPGLFAIGLINIILPIGAPSLWWFMWLRYRGKIL